MKRNGRGNQWIVRANGSLARLLKKHDAVLVQEDIDNMGFSEFRLKARKDFGTIRDEILAVIAKPLAMDEFSHLLSLIQSSENAGDEVVNDDQFYWNNLLIILRHTIKENLEKAEKLSCDIVEMLCTAMYDEDIECFPKECMVCLNRAKRLLKKKPERFALYILQAHEIENSTSSF